MKGDSSRCPDPEVLAAFVAGNLSGDQLRMTADHLLDCEDCRFIVGEAARADRDESNVVPIRSRRVAWWLAAAAAAIVCVAYLTWRPDRTSNGDAIALLVEAAPRDGRYLEPRLSGGFRWAPLRAPLRSDQRELDAGQMKLVGAAGTVLERTRGDESADASHATAIAHLVAGRPQEAAAKLAALAEKAPSAKVLSDLAAARYQTALQQDDSSHLAEALAAVDAALRIDARMPEALFNRALIIERLGLRDQARAAWQRYLAADPAGPWANEANQHLQRVGPVTEFRHELERRYASLQNDVAAARALAREFPQDARAWGESEILNRWGQAYQAGRHDDAAAHLRIARAFGEELAAGDERLLSGSVAAIDAAAEPMRLVLAGAHVGFRRAEQAYKAGNIVEAERLFTSAGEAFRQAGSPAALLASGLAANTIFDQGRIAEAKERLERQLRAVPASFSAHRAQLQWELGLVHAASGAWGSAIDAFRQSIATFERLRERRNATAVREILAQVYDRLGDPRTAWEHRMLAMPELGRNASKRLKIAIDAIGRGAASVRNWPVCLSFLGLQLELPAEPGEELMTIQTLLLRARVAALISQPASARDDLQLAKSVMARIADPALRERAEADRLAVEGIVTASPAQAVPLLTRAIDFHQQKGRRMFLPDLLLHRGRAYRAVGDDAAAASDFERGIADLESQRLSIAEGQDRWGMFASAEELFEEALLLAHRRGDVAAAFAYAERARARELFESMGDQPMTAPASRRDPGALVIEYVSLPATLMIFVVKGDDIHVVQQPVSRAELAAAADSLTRSAVANNGIRFRRHASAMHARLLAPIAKHVAVARTLVFVPDTTLSSVPFAALIDASGRYVVEQHTVVTSPSAKVFSHLSARRMPDDRDLQLLVMAGPSAANGELAPLTATAGELEAVASMYAGTVRLGENGGDPAVFAARAAGADVIHFGGHADADNPGGAALLTVRGKGGDDRLDVREIAGMRLRQTRTVVLAACGTARGQTRPGEGTISVARAFLAAGVPSVVATLWPIEDTPAAAFFPRLHEHLARGVAPADALRAAQLEWIRRKDAPPGMWAAVQLIGS